MIRLALCVLLALLASCSMFTREQRDTMREAINQEYQDGNITAAQRDAALEAIDSDEPFDWEGLGYAAINAALGGLLGFGAVRVQRGRPTQRVGLPASKVKPA